MEKAKSKVKKG